MSAPRTKAFWQDPWKCGLVVFLVALAVRLIYLQQLAATPFLDEMTLIVDAQYYDLRAREIASGEWGLRHPALLSPLYCYVLGLIYAVAGPGLYGAKLFQVVLGALSCVLLYLIGRRAFSDRAGLLAAAMLTFYAPHVYYHGLLLPPTLIVFVHLLVVWLLVGRFSVARAAIAGVLVGLAVLAKANAILLVPALAAVLAFVGGSDVELRRRLIAAGALAVAAAVTLVPITVANYRLTGEVFLVTTTGGGNLLKGNGPTATGSHAFLAPNVQTGVRAHLDDRVDARRAVAQSRELSRQAREYMLANPGRTIVLMGRKLLLLLNRQELGIRDQYDFAKTWMPLLRWPFLGFAVVVPLGLAGAVLGFRLERPRAVILAVLAVQVVSFVLIFVLARYRLVMVACLMPFAAELLLRVVDRCRRRAWGELWPAAVAVLVGTVLVWLPVGGFPRDHGWADQHRFVGERLLAGGDPERAADALEASLGASWVDPRLAPIHRTGAALALADAWERVGRRDEARALYEQVAPGIASAPPPFRADLERRARELAERFGP